MTPPHDESLAVGDAAPDEDEETFDPPSVEVAKPVGLDRRRGDRARRLRARRVRTEQLQVDGLEARGRHATLGSIRAGVEDLSLTGVALVLAGGGDKLDLVLTGDRLEKLDIGCYGATVYLGDAHVRRITERDGDLVLGVELQSGSIDLSELYRLGTRQSYSERLQAALDPSQAEVSNAFKLWVSERRSSLERLKAFLDSEEKALVNLDRFTRDQALHTYLEETAPRVVARLNEASGELAELVGDLSEDQHPIYRSYYKSQLLPLLMHSPLLRRAYSKPLGYAGDYEMMNMLYRDHAEGDSLFGRVLNVYAAQEPAARANINRLEYLSDKIRAAIEVRGCVRLASIGCGPARELGVLLEEHPELGRFLEVALIDQEEQVLTYCERTLSPFATTTGVKLHFIRESVRRLLTTRKLKEALGERDLIYSAGLFDYLNPRSFSALLGVLFDALAPGGHLCVGNVAADNPSRYFMEYGLDWFLIHRTPRELLDLAGSLEGKPRRVEVDSESSGVNLFLRVWK